MTTTTQDSMPERKDVTARIEQRKREQQQLISQQRQQQQTHQEATQSR